MKLFDLKNAGHWPTLLAAFLYFDFSFMVWTVLGPLGAQIGEKLNLSPEQYSSQIRSSPGSCLSRCTIRLQTNALSRPLIRTHGSLPTKPALFP
jgi:hypothetical protein